MSDKHSQRLDDALDKETESMQRGAPVEARAEEHRELEPAADGDPSPDTRITKLPDTDGPAMDPAALEQRSELARFLDGAAFPGDRSSLLASAEKNQATASVTAMLERLPEGESFENVQAVWRTLGGDEEQRF